MLALISFLASTLLVGCGQGDTSEPAEDEAAGEEVVLVEQYEMTATFVGLMDGSSFEVTTDAGEAMTIRFSEKDMEQLSTLDEGVNITFTYTVDENGQNHLEEIVAIQ